MRTSRQVVNEQIRWSVLSANLLEACLPYLILGVQCDDRINRSRAAAAIK